MSAILAAIMGLGDKLAAHVLLSAAAIALGIIVALPLAVWAGRSLTVSKIALGFASLVQTIPALALLALFFPDPAVPARRLRGKPADTRLPPGLARLGAVCVVADPAERGDRTG